MVCAPKGILASSTLFQFLLPSIMTVFPSRDVTDVQFIEKYILMHAKTGCITQPGRVFDCYLMAADEAKIAETETWAFYLVGIYLLTIRVT